ncbi:MAG: T9SS type A sorting domain-containing protein [Saprospiraceae bacterium]|nr:T9SS type A sorting domain-containing protein [Saprospiraceae bacterium]
MKIFFKYYLLIGFFSSAGLNFIYAQFNNPQLVFAGNAGPWELVYVADVDGDGHTDLVTQHEDNNSIYLSRNDGQGNFSTGELMIQNHIFYGMIDYGDDGDLDLIAKDLATGIIRLYENDGFGDYSYWLQNFAYSLVSPVFYGDMDGDGDKDYLFGTGSGIGTSVYCCETGPPFPYCVQINAVGSDFTLCAGYFDQDNMVDYCISYNKNQGYAFYTNLGSGHFVSKSLPTGFPVMTYNLPKGVGCADINGDGFEDLYFWSVDLGRIVWMANDGNANFGPVQAIVDEAGLTATSLLIRPGDCDKDGDADFLLLTDYGIRLFRNDGPGGFVEVPLSDVPDADIIFFEDIDGDGYDDIVIGQPNKVLWLPNDGACQFGDPQLALLLLQPDPESVSIADLDQNGKPDMLLSAPATGLIGWFPNLGNARFGSLRAVATDLKQPIDAFAADLNGDLLPDVLTIQGAKAQPGYYPALGNGRFADFVPLLPDSVEFNGLNIHAADANDDGKQDLFLSGALARADAVLLLVNAGAGQFEAPLNLASLLPGGFCQREHPDMDHDGDPDLLYREEPNSKLYWRPNDGDGNYGSAIPVIDTVEFVSLQVADLNGDEFPDIIVGAPNGAIAWFENQQAGQTFVQRDIAAAAAIQRAIVALDFDGDGDQDIWTAPRPDSAAQEQRIVVFENDGTGNFLPAVSRKSNGYGHTAAGAADMDVDGDSDVYFCSGLFGGWYSNRQNRPVIAGFCFEDVNENGLFDSGDLPIPEMPLRIQPSGLLAYSKVDGTFLFTVPEGDYSLAPEPQACWALTSDSASYSVNFSGAPVLNKLFGFKNLGSPPSVLPHISPSHPQCGRVVPYWISVKNTSCQSLSGRLAVVHNSETTFIGSTIPPSEISGDTLWWNFDSLRAFETFQPAIDFQMALSSTFGKFDSMEAIVFLKNPDGSLYLSGAYTHEYFINCGEGWFQYKSVNKEYVDNNTIIADNELRYMIRFQNPGPDTVADLRLWDRLDTNLIWSSFRMLGSSHPVNVFLDENTGIVEFYLPDVHLPDSMNNLAASRGCVSFGIQMKPDIVPASLYSHTQVFNTAIVYFDDRLPVPTNEVGTIVYHTVGLSGAPELYPLAIFPNPTSGVINVELPQAAKPGLLLRIADLAGRVVLETKLETGSTRHTVQAGSLPNGLYYLQVTNGGTVLATTKFIKQ